jgi:uncharacterized protein YecE (DUF72 family)
MRKARTPSKTRNRSSRGLTNEHKLEIRVGISGWRYPGWRGKFYPQGLAQKRELEFASGAFNSVEINGSFYSLQLPSSYRRWFEATPPDFVFAVKGGRFITHMKKLKDVEIPLANFFASGVLALRQKLGPILWQLPPGLGWNKERLANFFQLLPRNMRDAALLAKKHDHKLKARAFAKIERAMAERPIRHAIEVRHPSFMTPEFFDLLRLQRIAFVFADTAKKWPYAEDITADFIYVRLHGDEKLYVSGYSDNALDWWADRIGKWRKCEQPPDAKLITPHRTKRNSCDVYVYFDNDAKVHAPYDAIRLAKRLGLNSRQ